MKTKVATPRRPRQRTPDDWTVTEKDNTHLGRAAERVAEIGMRCWGDPDGTYLAES